MKRFKKFLKEGKRIPKTREGQDPDTHSDLYTDEDPKDTIHGLGFKNEAKAKESVAKIKRSGRKHAHKIQAAIAMEQRAKAAGKKAASSVYRGFIEKMKKKTKKMNESMDTLLPYDRVKDEKQDDMRHVHHEISVPDGSTVTVEKRTDSDNEMSVKFKSEGSGQLTGKGKHQFGILNTVRHIVRNEASQQGVGAVKFSITDNDEKRHKVYSKMAERIGKKLPPVDQLQRINL